MSSQNRFVENMLDCLGFPHKYFLSLDQKYYFLLRSLFVLLIEPSALQLNHSQNRSILLPFEPLVDGKDLSQN